MKKVSKQTAFGGGLLIGGASQLSRNKNIRNAGGLVLFATIMGAIGEFLGLLIKWIILEPIKIVCKIFWVFTVFICKTSWRLTVISSIVLKKESIKLYKYLKIKYNTKKTI